MHAFVNELERPLGTYLYGRRVYEVMAVWETLEDPAPEMQRLRRDLAGGGQGRLLAHLAEGRRPPGRRCERRFEPDAVRALKDASERDLGIGGPTLAAEAIRAGLVDEWQFLLSPALVGGGKPSLPDGIRIDLELTDSRTFGNGAVFLRYRTRA